MDFSKDDIDPSVAAFLSESDDSTIQIEEYKTPSQGSASSNLIKKNLEAQAQAMSSVKMNGGVPEVDLSIKEFAPITKFFEETGSKVYDDPAYYKTCLTGEGDASQRLHQLLLKYLNCTDKKDKTLYRQQMVGAYWEFLRTMAPKLTNPSLPECKRMAMRFGVVLPSLFTPEQKDYFSRAVFKNVMKEPVFYFDEWMKEIALGHLKPSTTDEAPVRASSKAPGAEQARLMQLKSKNSGKLQSSEGLVTTKESERNAIESSIRQKIEDLLRHDTIIGLEPHKSTFTDIQRKMFADISNDFRTLQRIDKELANYLRELQEAKEIEQSLNDKTANMQVEVNVGKEEILGEMTTIRQMAKMTCGRQGNQFPVFTKEFFHCLDRTTGFRENVLRELAWIESIDPQCFCRIHKNVPHRIVPFTLLIPSYGDIGFCWEPFDRYNRVTSRGRIVIPMYPRDIKIACLSAVADLRWQVAKEKASFDWMSDGLTGHYYQHIEELKLKGDVKQFFIDDYILWITKESNGIQKLDKEVRAIFWRYMPFTQEKKKELEHRSPVYMELCQRDKNREMSDGY